MGVAVQQQVVNVNKGSDANGYANGYSLLDLYMMDSLLVSAACSPTYVPYDACYMGSMATPQQVGHPLTTSADALQLVHLLLLGDS
jgi:hypothetical protein